MPLRILTNTQSLFSQQSLGKAQSALNKALERLSTGSRINHSYDDPSGYLFAVQMQFQISGTDAGTNNLRMAIDLLNTADSYTRTITENLTRLNELATQATNSLLTTQQRNGLSFEFNEIMAEVQRLTTNATYNGRLLMNGSLVAVTIQSGYSVADVVTMSINCLTTGTASGLAIYSAGAGLIGLGTVQSAASAIGVLNSVAANYLAPTIASIGAQSAGWTKSAEAQDTYSVNLRAARSRIFDADIAAETTNLTNAQVIVQSGIAALAQANSAATLAMGLIGQ